MSKLDLKKELAGYDKKQLIGLISELYGKNKSVREYLDHFITLDDKTFLKEYKTKIKGAFFSKNGSYNLAAGKKAISDFKKIGGSSTSLIELMLYYTECALKFTNNYGDINERFYLSLEKAYGDALYLIDKESLYSQFKEKAQKIFADSDNIGWGVHETLSYYYYDVFRDEDDFIEE